MKMGKSFIIAGLLTCLANIAMAQVTPTSQMEKLNRGLVVVPGNSGEFISWRFLGTDDEDNTTFDVLRDNEVVGKDIAASTCFSDA